MLNRHANQLHAALERVADIGVAEIRKNDLLRWYSQERLTINIWRDIDEKWQEYDECPLFAAEADGVMVFVYAKGLKSSPDAWLKDVAVLAKRKQPDAAEAA